MTSFPESINTELPTPPPPIPNSAYPEELETPPPLPLPSIHTHPLFLTGQDLLKSDKKQFVSSLVLTDNLRTIITLSSPTTFEHPDNASFRPLHSTTPYEADTESLFNTQHPTNIFNNITDFPNPLIDHQTLIENLPLINNQPLIDHQALNNDQQIIDVQPLINDPQLIDDQLLINDPPLIDDQPLIEDHQQMIEPLSNDQLLILNQLVDDRPLDPQIKNDLSLNSTNSIEIINQTPAPHQQEYICKVEPNEFDLSLDSAVTVSNPDVIDQILPAVVAEDKTIPKAIYICSKPALVAVELGAVHETIDTDKSTILVDPEPESNIPMLIVSEVPSAVPNPDEPVRKSLKSIKSQDSLELPIIDDRENVEDILRTSDSKKSSLDKSFLIQVGLVSVDVKPDASELAKNDLNSAENGQHDFVFLTNEDVEQLKRDEQTYEQEQFQKDSLDNTYEQEQFQTDSLENQKDSLDSVDSSKLLPLLIQLKADSNITNTETTNNDPIIIDEILKPTNSISSSDADVEIRKPLLNDDGDLPGILT